jgi:hypothetical protein
MATVLRRHLRWPILAIGGGLIGVAFLWSDRAARTAPQVSEWRPSPVPKVSAADQKKWQPVIQSTAETYAKARAIWRAKGYREGPSMISGGGTMGFRFPEDRARYQREQDEKLIEQLKSDHPYIDFSRVVFRPRGRVLEPVRRPHDPFAAVLEFPDDPPPKLRFPPLARHLVEPGISIKWKPLPVPTFRKAVRDEDSKHDAP